MDLYTFIAILVPKLVAMVTPLYPLCTGVSQMNSPIAQTLSQNQTLHGCVAYNWSYSHFWATVSKTVRAMLSVCLSVTFVHCGQTVGMQVGLGPGHIVLDGDPAPPKGHSSPLFSADVYCGHERSPIWVSAERLHSLKLTRFTDKFSSPSSVTSISNFIRSKQYTCILNRACA